MKTDIKKKGFLFLKNQVLRSRSSNEERATHVPKTSFATFLVRGTRKSWCQHQLKNYCSTPALFTNNNVKYKVLKTHNSYKHKQIMCVFRANIEDQKKRAHFVKHECQKIVLKTLLTINRNVRVTRDQKLKFEKLKCFKLSTHKMCGPTLRLIKPFNKKQCLKKSSFALIRNRCILSGRSTIVGKFRLSRINFRHYAHYAKLVGVSKC